MLSKPVFVLTVPKSGTHLIANLLRAVLGPENVYSGLVSAEALLEAGFVRQPIAYVGHVEYSLQVARRLEGAVKVLLGRDPRDVVVSWCSAVYNRRIPPDTLMNYALAQQVPFGELLSTLITGGEHDGLAYRDVQALYTVYYLRWLALADVVVRYEDLLPQAAGWVPTRATLRPLLDALGITLTDAELDARLLAGSAPERSATFNAGKPGRWQGFFQPAHVVQFKSVAPGLVSALGYEPDERWGLGAPPPPLAAAGPAAPRSDTPPAAAVPAALLAEVEALQARLKRIRSLDDWAHQRISFLELPALDLGFFCYTDDRIQQALNQQFVDHRRYESFLAETGPHPRPAGVRQILADRRASPIYHLLRPALAAGRRVRLLNAGCYYGLEAVLLSGLLGEWGDAFQVTAFDPGPAGRLAAFNFEINGQASRIHHEPLAVTDHTRTSIVYGEYGYLENCRTVNRMVATETFSYPCASTTLDAYVSGRPAAEDFFVRLELQGGEYQALRGARQLLQSPRCLGAVIKFVPHALSGSGEPAQLWELLPAGSYIADLGLYSIFQGVTRVTPLTREGFADFTAGLWNANPDYTYLLVLPPASLATRLGPAMLKALTQSVEGGEAPAATLAATAAQRLAPGWVGPGWVGPAARVFTTAAALAGALMTAVRSGLLRRLR